MRPENPGKEEKEKRFQSHEHVAPKMVKLFFELYKINSLQQMGPVV